MLRTLKWLTVFAVILLSPRAALAALDVVATTPDLGSIARAIGGKHVRVSVLALHTQDPHWVDPKPHLALALSKADLLITTGAELENGWLPTLQTGSRNGRIQSGAHGFLDCSALVDLLEAPAGKVDRSAGDVHVRGNPHYMLDPRAVERVAVGIAKKLAALDAAHKPAFFDATKRFIAELRKARTGWEARLSGVRRAKIVAYHRAFPYLANWLELSIIEHVEPRPGIAPNPSHVKHVIARARAERVRALIQQEWYPKATSELIANKAGTVLVVLPGMPNFEKGQSYVAFMDEVVARLAKAIGG
jgi:zinc/manganese transport system substrate-binding protein